MNHLSLFSGIGGFDLPAEWMGWENVAHCEINPFGRKILKYYWPKAISYEDITKTDFSIHRGAIDVLTGGFPCQPYSVAGLRKGDEDERHLWPEMLRAIREIEPRWIVGENVLGLASWNGGLVFEEVQADLEAEGYEVQPYVLPAASVGAPHRRDRIWFVAYDPSSNRRARQREAFEAKIRKSGSQQDRELEGGFKGFCASKSTPNSKSERSGKLRDKSKAERSQNSDELLREQYRVSYENAADTHSDKRCKGRCHPNRSEKTERHFGLLCPRTAGNTWENFPTQPPICDGDDGLSSFMDSDTFFRELGIEHPRRPSIGFAKWRNESIKAGGNAIVPQVVHQIFKAIEEYEKLTNPSLG